MQNQSEDEHPRARSLMLLTAVCFVLVGALDLLVGEWVSAAFFLCGALLFFQGTKLERWPKAARYLFVLLFFGLTVLMFVNLIMKMKARA